MPQIAFSSIVTEMHTVHNAEADQSNVQHRLASSYTIHYAPFQAVPPRKFPGRRLDMEKFPAAAWITLSSRIVWG
ncbi:hypothetical protein [Paenibacillus sp. P32E]|uniref:hypothetical protein n=1 Tax=Paenibacillus sp. P32E TaxID=1349434 RepID=UPI0015B98A3C|nr:hypothetical protein [Paenibacillus sp. P32E]